MHWLNEGGKPIYGKIEQLLLYKVIVIQPPSRLFLDGLFFSSFTVTVLGDVTTNALKAIRGSRTPLHSLG